MPSGCSFHITLRCNSRQVLIAKALRRGVLQAVLKKAKQKFAVKDYGLCLMANHLHLLIKPEEAKDLPRLMNWAGTSF
ncbi:MULTISPECIES: transposase [Prochlorococcus]